MPHISALCLSDLHLGSETSVLTALDHKTHGPDVDETSPVLERLVECMKWILRHNEGARKPRLVLAGDVLELALVTDNLAASVFAQFARLLFDAAELPFHHSIIFVPGNHDHHLWEAARESQYASYLSEPETAFPLKHAPWHTTHLFPWRKELNVPNRDVESSLLTALIRRVRPGTAAHVLAMYPNFGILSADGRRCTVIHHGHFTESTYYLMTDLGKLVFPGRSHPDEIWDVEAENYAWIDFLWGTLGRSGDIGKDVGLVYNMLKSEKTTSRLVWSLTRSIPRAIRRPLWAKLVAGPLALFGLLYLARKHRGQERGISDLPLSDSSLERLTKYIRTYVHGQLKRECKSGMPDRLTFVFGHTHKPFEKIYDIEESNARVPAYNMGGWVVDRIDTAPEQGAALVVIDEDGHAASIRMYNQDPDPSNYRVRVAKAGNGEGEPNPLYDWLHDLIKPEEPPWSDFSGAAAKAVEERRRNMERVLKGAGK